MKGTLSLRWLILSGWILVILLGCAKEEMNDKKIISVEVVKPEIRELEEVLELVGTIEGIEQVTVFPKAGGKLIKYLVKEGDYVEKDSIIALIDRDITGFQYEPHQVLSPIAGKVLKADIDKGTSIDVNTPLAVVGNIDTVKVKVEISEVEYPKVKVGQDSVANVDAYPDRVFSGKLLRLSNLIDVNTRTAQAEIFIPNPQHLLIPGMFTRVNLIVGKYKSLTIPLDGLLRMPGTGSYYCFKVEKDRVKKVFLKIGIIQNGFVEIKDGINLDDLVVISGQGVLEDGSKVKPVLIEKEEDKANKE